MKPFIEPLKKACIKEALNFRHHLTGKRIIDYSKNLDDYKKYQYRFADQAMGALCSSEGNVLLRISLKGNNKTFDLKNDHACVMEECYAIFEAIIEGLCANELGANEFNS